MELKTARQTINDEVNFATPLPLLVLEIESALKSYATQAVRMALEEAGTLVDNYHVDKDSILSLADEIIGKLK